MIGPNWNKLASGRAKSLTCEHPNLWIDFVASGSFYLFKFFMKITQCINVKGGTSVTFFKIHHVAYLSWIVCKYIHFDFKVLC